MSKGLLGVVVVTVMLQILGHCGDLDKFNTQCDHLPMHAGFSKRSPSEGYLNVTTHPTFNACLNRILCCRR